MQQIKREELKKMIDKNADFALVDSLQSKAFEKVHIPDSINLPIGSDDFDELAFKKIPDKDKKVVVYCASPD